MRRSPAQPPSGNGPDAHHSGHSPALNLFQHMSKSGIRAKQ